MELLSDVNSDLVLRFSQVIIDAVEIFLLVLCLEYFDTLVIGWASTDKHYMKLGTTHLAFTHKFGISNTSLSVKLRLMWKIQM